MFSYFLPQNTQKPKTTNQSDIELSIKDHFEIYFQEKYFNHVLKKMHLVTHCKRHINKNPL